MKIACAPHRPSEAGILSRSAEQAGVAAEVRSGQAKYQTMPARAKRKTLESLQIEGAQSSGNVEGDRAVMVVK